MRYAEDTVWIDSAQTAGFQDVPAEVWTLRIGDYQVCEKWLKDRRGRALDDEDIAHYRKMLGALRESLRLSRDIDKVIEEHGGWSVAFNRVRTA